jgi:type VI secretion system protein
VRAIGCLLLLPALLCATGCHKVKQATTSPLKLKSYQKFTIQVNVSENANQNNPIPMDFVIVDDKKLVKEVARLSSKDWFERRTQVQRDFPGKLTVASWEWVPGQHAGPISVDINRDIKAGFLFAQYQNGGDHRAVVDVRAPIVVTCSAEDFNVQPLK